MRIDPGQIVIRGPYPKVVLTDNADIRRENLRLLIKQKGRATVRVQLRMSHSQLSQIAGPCPRRAIGNPLARRIEDTFGLGKGWMDWLHDEQNAAPAQEVRRRVNLMGATEDVSLDPADQSGGRQIFATGEVGPRAFALEVRGRSMQPEFQEGDHVLIDPDVNPVPGDFVAARLAGGVTTFRKYRPRSPGVYELAPVNEDYAVLRSDQGGECEIIGTMVEHHRYRRHQ